VSWHPPITLLSGLELPGPDLGHMEISEVHQGIRQGEATLQRTAEQLGTTIDALRHLLEKPPPPETSELADRCERPRGWRCPSTNSPSCTSING